MIILTQPMNILDLVSQYLESRGFVCGPAFNPGCFFYVDRRGVKNKICLYRKDGKPINIMRTKEPTVILVYRGWTDDVKSSLLDLTPPESLEELGALIDED